MQILHKSLSESLEILLREVKAADFHYQAAFRGQGNLDELSELSFEKI